MTFEKALDYEKQQKLEIGTEESVPNLQESPDLISCDELHRLLRKTLGEAKHVHDTLKDQLKSHSDLKAENQRLKAECHRYRALLGEAATQYGDLYEMAMTDDRMYRTMLNDATLEFTNLAAKHEAAEKFVECATSCGYIAVDVHNNALRIKDEQYKELEKVVDECLGDNLMYRTMLNDAAEAYKRERDRSSENCEQVRDGWKEIVRHCLDDAVMYCDLLRDAKRGYVRLMDERDELNAYANDQHEKLREAELKIQQLESRCEMESNSCSKAIDERDKYKAACEAAQSLNRDMMDGLKNYIELPKGEDGEHINMGDTVRFCLTGEPFEVNVITFYAKGDAFVADESNEGARAKYCNHVTQPDPIEDTFREYELGNLTSSEAIERIKEATNG